MTNHKSEAFGAKAELLAVLDACQARLWRAGVRAGMTAELANALGKIERAIDEAAFVLTGDRQFFGYRGEGPSTIMRRPKESPG